MAIKENAKKSIVMEKLKLINSKTGEVIIIADDDELVNYDVRLWRIM